MSRNTHQSDLLELEDQQVRPFNDIQTSNTYRNQLSSMQVAQPVVKDTAVSTINYIEDCSAAIETLSKNQVDLNQRIVIQDDATNESAILQFFIGLSTESRIGLTMFGLSLFGYMAFLASFAYVLVAIVLILIVLFGFKTFVSNKEAKIKSDMEKRRQTNITNSQIFSNNVTSAVATQASNLHKMKLQGLEEQHRRMADARLKEISDVKGMHSKELDHVLGMSGNRQDGLMDRTKLKIETMLKSTRNVVQTDHDITTKNASLETKIVSEEMQMSAESLQNNLYVAHLENSTKLKVKSLQVKRDLVNKQNSADREKSRILAEKRRVIEEERQKTDELRRRLL